MMQHVKKVAVATESPIGERYDELRRMLIERQAEITTDVQNRMRKARMEGSERDYESLNPNEARDSDIQDDIEWTLIQMRAQTLERVKEALARLEDGTYGNCFECGYEIPHPRLRALPFAVRCKDCEEAREFASERERAMRRTSSPLGFTA